MKLTIRLPIVMTTSGLVLPMVEAHIIQAAQDVLDALPDEIKRLNKLGCIEIAQKLADLQDTLREAKREPEKDDPCPHCKGEGWNIIGVDETGRCASCHGSGKAKDGELCPHCKGEGWDIIVVDETERCPFCLGSGKAEDISI